MNRTLVPPLNVVQNCYVVRNLEEACRRFSDLYGIGPFVGGGEGGVLEDHVYRGAPAAPVRLRAAFVQSGELNIELIEPVSDGPSAIHDMFPNGESGFHHVAVFTENYEAERDRFVSLGMPVASEFTIFGGLRLCYIDARETLGHMIELYPEAEALRALYRRTREAAQTWDGKQLIVPF